MVVMLMTLLAGAGVTLLLVGFARGESSDSISARLNNFVGQPPTLRDVELAAAPKDRLLKPASQRLARLLSGFQGAAAIEKMEKQLLMAGSPNGMTVEDLLGWKGLAAVGLAAGAIFVALLMHGSFIRLLMFAGGGAVAGYFLPSLYLRQKIKKRQKAILKSLPDAIDMLSISVEAGLAFDAALGRLSARVRNELIAEFDRVSTEIRMGKRRRDALRNLIERTGVDDLNSFVNALIQADQLGVGVANVLKTQSKTLRIRRRQRAEEKARQAPVKMMFPMVGLLFPPLIIIILGPAIPALMHGMSGGH